MYESLFNNLNTVSFEAGEQFFHIDQIIDSIFTINIYDIIFSLYQGVFVAQKTLIT